jgi:signal transduction histidine kinase
VTRTVPGTGAREALAPAAAAASRPRILLVDDRESNLLAMRAVLEDVGEVRLARSGEQALRLLLVDDVALVLLDVQMPGMDGFETAEAIRGRPRTRDVPILFLSAYEPREEDLVRGYAVGAADYLVKPVAPDVLRAKASLFVELQVRRGREERIRQDLLRSNGELARFAQAAAHDLQAPLRSLDYLLRRVATAGTDRLDPGQRADLAECLEATGRMRRLIGGLLDYAQARTGVARPGAADLASLVAEAWAALRASVESTGATLACEALPVVRADALLLRQVFQNLFENAIRHRGDGPPRVHVSARETPEGVEVSVRDEGTGIAPEHHEAVFEPFRRLGPRRPDAGSGLGLAICREIVARHGGRISVASEVGRGATFRFTLPGA